VKAPEGFAELRAGGARLLLRPEARSWAEESIERHGTLHAAAAHHPDARRMEGRGSVYAVPAEPDALEAALDRNPGRWAVRHYRRGGLVARLLGDRYLRVGTSRPFRELEASEAARARRIPTPRVVAAAVYPAGLFYRGDLVTAYIPDTVELAGVVCDRKSSGLAGSGDRKDAGGEAGAERGVGVRRAGGVSAEASGRYVAVRSAGPPASTTTSGATTPTATTRTSTGTS
jgi:hypothetical protein